MIKAVRGTRDILPPESLLWNRVEAIAREVFRLYNYQEIRTPIFEETRLFARGVGEETDIVTKEMYTFVDRDGTSLTLRPENTAAVIRAYIEHGLQQRPGLKRLYYMGPMFRRERPQKGRYRQFYQIGAEAIGSESPWVDAEMIELSLEILGRCGLRDYKLLINSVGCFSCRPPYVEELREALRQHLAELSADSRRRTETNPLRVLDSKAPEDQPIISRLPKLLDRLCQPCREHFAQVRAILQQLGIEFEVEPRLVRGLDYYTRTTYEVIHGALGAQNSVLGGGRYDGLAEALGAKLPAPGIGFSIGQDRLILILQSEGLAQEGSAGPVAFVAPVGAELLPAAYQLGRKLRLHGVPTEVALDGRLRKSLELANKIGAQYAIILGEDELKAGKVTLRNMETGVQETLTEEELLRRFSS